MNKLQIILLLVSSFCIVSNNYTSVQVQVVKYCTVNGVKKPFKELGIPSKNSEKDDIEACQNQHGSEYSIGRSIIPGVESIKVIWPRPQDYYTRCNANRHCCVGGGENQEKTVTDFYSCMDCCAASPSDEKDDCIKECKKAYSEEDAKNAKIIRNFKNAEDYYGQCESKKKCCVGGGKYQDTTVHDIKSCRGCCLNSGLDGVSQIFCMARCHEAWEKPWAWENRSDGIKGNIPSSYYTKCEENKHCCVGGGQYQDKSVTNFLSCINCCTDSKLSEEDTSECHIECQNAYL